MPMQNENTRGRTDTNEPLNNQQTTSLTTKQHQEEWKNEERNNNNNKMDMYNRKNTRIVECQGYHTAVNIYRKTET